MSDLRELYQEVILDHSKKPRNFMKLEGADRIAEGYNPLCGDVVTVYLQLEDGVIRKIGFQGSGCAISKASASMMTDSVKGKTKDDAQVLFEKFHHLVTGEAGDPDDLGKVIGKQGRTARAIRTLLGTAGSKHNKRVLLEILE